MILGTLCVNAPNCDLGSLEIQGYFESVKLDGNRTAGQIGIAQGGGTWDGTSLPDRFIGYNYTVRDVSIQNFEDGIVWGYGCFNISWYNVDSSNNTSWLGLDRYGSLWAEQ